MRSPHGAGRQAQPDLLGLRVNELRKDIAIDGNVVWHEVRAVGTRWNDQAQEAAAADWFEVHEIVVDL
jgi:hypothetical protein